MGAHLAPAADDSGRSAQLCLHVPPQRLREHACRHTVPARGSAGGRRRRAGGSQPHLLPWLPRRAAAAGAAGLAGVRSERAPYGWARNATPHPGLVQSGQPTAPRVASCPSTPVALAVALAVAAPLACTFALNNPRTFVCTRAPAAPGWVALTGNSYRVERPLCCAAGSAARSAPPTGNGKVVPLYPPWFATVGIAAAPKTHQCSHTCFSTSGVCQ
jgi:hypothetical protein